ncbi:MAG: TrkA family potassium uptake protein [Ignavibacteriales bacterium]|nr:TrkA family potassium uptake protein [Ignavibacteriales bacterium]
MKKKYAVIGLGDLGGSIAISLQNTGSEVLAIDMDESIINDLKDVVGTAIRADSTDEKALTMIGIDSSVDAAIVAIGPDNFENTILTSVILLEKGVKKVVARASSKLQESILLKLGVHQVLIPDVQIARQIVSLITSQDVLDTIFLGEDYNIVYLKTPRSFVGKSLQELDLRIRYNVNLITIKRREKTLRPGNTELKEEIYGVPTASTILEENDVMIVFGKDKDIKKIVE